MSARIASRDDHDSIPFVLLRLADGERGSNMAASSSPPCSVVCGRAGSAAARQRGSFLHDRMAGRRKGVVTVDPAVRFSEIVSPDLVDEPAFGLLQILIVRFFDSVVP